MKVRICSTAIAPRYEIVQSSRNPGEFYTVIPSTLWNDAICTCKGYQFRQKCKHIDDIEKDSCHWASGQELDKETCPDCAASTILFDLDPEIVPNVVPDYIVTKITCNSATAIVENGGNNLMGFRVIGPGILFDTFVVEASSKNVIVLSNPAMVTCDNMPLRFQQS